MSTMIEILQRIIDTKGADMSNDKMRDEFDSWIERQGMSTMKDGETYYHRVTHVAWQAWKASRAAPDIAVQGEPVADLLIGEPEYTKQGWEPGDWDIEPNATTIEAFAKLAKPGAYQLYLAPQPAEQPALAVAALAEALERARDRIESERRSGEWDPLLRDIDAALAAHRKHGG